MSQPWCSALPGRIRLALLIGANASKTEVIGVQDDALKLKLQALPIEGRANQALIKYLAQTLAVPRSALTITHGASSKRKLIEVAAAGLTVEAVVARLLPSLT